MTFFRLTLIGLALLFVIIGLTMLVEKIVPSTMETAEQKVENIPILDESNPLTQSSCEQAGGAWNECGSACREDPGAPCIQVCVAYCECTSDAQCPAGLTCGGFVDGGGVCVK